MRWSREHHHNGERTTRKRFLWLPKRCGHQLRWLETACWSEDWDAKKRCWRPMYWLADSDTRILARH